ncbi:MAG: DUF2062 domain-containing protein [Rubrivivax sp.]|jgi:hypothetical protein|nr:DUF2062 domain-containing protein [Rubrivivax sp.]
MFERLRRLMPSHEAVASNRWLRWLGPRVLHPRLWHLSRRGVATGAAIGVFFAFITPIAQIPLSAAACVVLRANVPVSIVATLVNTPPTFGPVYYAAWKVGSWVLDEPDDEASAPQVLTRGPAPAASGASAPESSAPQGSWWARTVQTLQEIGKPLLVGTLIFSVGFSALAWALCNGIWHWRVRRKRRRRLAKTAARA